MPQQSTNCAIIVSGGTIHDSYAHDNLTQVYTIVQDHRRELLVKSKSYLHF